MTTSKNISHFKASHAMLVVVTFILSLIPFSGESGNLQPKSFQRAKTELVTAQRSNEKKTSSVAFASGLHSQNDFFSTVSAVQFISRFHSRLTRIILVNPQRHNLVARINLHQHSKTIPSASDEDSFLS